MRLLLVITTVCLGPIAVDIALFQFMVLGAATKAFALYLGWPLLEKHWWLLVLGIPVPLGAGATCLLNLRKRKSCAARDRQLRSPVSSRFVD